MFGTLRPHLCRLDGEAEREYRRFYCGLCKSLGDGYGTPLRATLTHDAVLVAVLADGLMTKAADASSCRCPINPLVHRATAASSETVMRFAAAVQLLLGDQWLADRAQDVVADRAARSAT